MILRIYEIQGKNIKQMRKLHKEDTDEALFKWFKQQWSRCTN